VGISIIGAPNNEFKQDMIILSYHVSLSYASNGP